MYGIHRKAFTTFLQSIYEKVSKAAAMLALIKIINIISGYAMQKRYVAVHTTMNKVTGVLLFMLPLTLTIVPIICTGIPTCSVATFAAVQEGYFIRTGKRTKQKIIATESVG